MTNVRRVEGILKPDEVVESLEARFSDVAIGVHKENVPEQSHGRWAVFAQFESSRFQVHLGYGRKRKKSSDVPTDLVVQGLKGCAVAVLDDALQILQKTLQELKSKTKRWPCNFCDSRWWGWTCYMCGKVVEPIDLDV